MKDKLGKPRGAGISHFTSNRCSGSPGPERNVQVFLDDMVGSVNQKLTRLGADVFPHLIKVGSYHTFMTTVLQLTEYNRRAQNKIVPEILEI